MNSKQRVKFKEEEKTVKNILNDPVRAKNLMKLLKYMEDNPNTLIADPIILKYMDQDLEMLKSSINVEDITNDNIDDDTRTCKSNEYIQEDSYIEIEDSSIEIIEEKIEEQDQTLQNWKTNDVVKDAEDYAKTSKKVDTESASCSNRYKVNALKSNSDLLKNSVWHKPVSTSINLKS